MRMKEICRRLQAATINFLAHPWGDLLFQERCGGCRSPVRRAVGEPLCICKRCWSRVLAMGPAEHERFSLGGGSLLTVVSGALYAGPLKPIIYKLKYDNGRLLACDLAWLLARSWRSLCPDLERADEATLVPIPLHRERLQKRGYNQAELLARSAATILHLPVAGSALVRVKDTIAQHGLGRAERLQNLKGSFAGDRRVLNGKTVVLVDDLHTSGATLKEAALACLGAGAAEVAAMTVARAVLR